MYRLRTLGALDLTDAGGDRVRAVLSQPKRLGLLAYLAVARPRGAHQRDTLLGLFWPEFDQARARRALRNALYHLRRSLGSETLVTVGESDVGLNPALVDSDVGGFDEALRAGDLGRALDLYGGDFLKGFFVADCPDFDQWADGERLHLREAAADAAWSLAERRVRAGDLTAGERLGQRALGMVSTDESAVRAFIASLSAAGDRAAALRFYERFAGLLDAELGVEPSAETRALFGQVLAQDLRIRAEASPASPSASDTRPSVAVLPFTSFGDEPGTGDFGPGVTEDILARLARVRGIRVVSRTRAFQMGVAGGGVREVARTLGVATILEGSVRRSGDRVRVVAQLIDGRTDEHLWADTYDRDLGDVFAVQADIAECIARALRAELSEDEKEGVRRIRTEDLEAWHCYVRGVQAFQGLGPSELAEGLAHLEEALRRDVDFAQAWALSAQIRVLGGMCASEPPSTLFPPILEATQRALDSDPRCGEAHAARGVIRLFHDWDPAGAQESLTRALDLAPDDSLALGWQAIFLALDGRPDPALAVARQAVVSDPHSAAAHLVLGQVLVMAGRIEEAVRVLEPACHLWSNAVQLRMWLGLALASSGQPGRALPHYERAEELTGGLPHFAALRATALVALGREDEARATRWELVARSRAEYVDPYSTFVITLVLDGFEAAVPYLEQMIEARSIFLPYLRAIPRFRALQADPRFRRVMDRVWPGVAPVH
jgi:TolB-like protein/Tfp pilus assembly protein PilF